MEELPDCGSDDVFKPLETAVIAKFTSMALFSKNRGQTKKDYKAFIAWRRKGTRRLTNSALIERFIRESIRCIES